jgi:hypothetical protein
MAIVTATVDQRQHRTPHLMKCSLSSVRRVARQHDRRSNPLAHAGRRDQKAVLAANTRLVAIERERRELKERIAALAAQLKRDER